MSQRQDRELPEAGAEILWDTWGVPHIFAADEGSLLEAFGWAQMHNHGDLILRLFGQARGRAAEYWGEAYLPSDRLTWTMGLPERAREWVAAQEPDTAARLERFVAGINAYAAAYPERLAADVGIVLPVTPVDVLGNVQRMFMTFLILSGQNANPDKPLPVITEGIPVPLGSNAWAIGPAHSESGNALLLANPHLPWSDLYTWIEVQLVAPGYEFYGITLAGMPGLTIGFSDALGWSHTVNSHNGMTAYRLTETDGGYLFDNEVRAFDVELRTLKVKAADGSLREEPLTIRRSVHGPVLTVIDGAPVALRMTAVDQAQIPGMLEQWWAMSKASDLEDFQAALRRHQMPMFNVLYADRDGHVLYHFGGQVPLRPSGGWLDWAGLVPGDTSDTLWTEVLPFEALPLVVDPPSGWVQNSNSPPWLSTMPPALDPRAFPPYLAPPGLRQREQSGLRMLTEHGPFSFDALVEAHRSAYAPLADALLPELIATAEQGGAQAREAAAVLAGWNRRIEADQAGATLFLLWLMEMVPLGTPLSGLFAEPWDPARPFETPRGLADPLAAAVALETAAAKLSAIAGGPAVPWGELFRLRRGGVDLPAHGGFDPTGSFRVLNYAPAADGRFEAIGGTTWVAVVEFGQPQRAEVLLAPGNASQPGSPHLGDQLPLYANKELRPVWRQRADIEAHLEAREILPMG